MRRLPDENIVAPAGAGESARGVERRVFLGFALASMTPLLSADARTQGRQTPKGQKNKTPQPAPQANGPADLSCASLTAADPLYYYSELVLQLIPAAQAAARRQEDEALHDLSIELNSLWKLSEKLKAALPAGLSQALPRVEHLNALATAGRANLAIIEAAAPAERTTTAKAVLASQQVITKQMGHAASGLLQEGRVTLSRQASGYLRDLLKKIDEIQARQHPAYETARTRYISQLDSINSNALGAQGLIKLACSKVAAGKEKEADAHLDEAVTKLNALPGGDSAGADSGGAGKDERITRDDLVALLRATQDMINGRKGERADGAGGDERRALFVAAAFSKPPGRPPGFFQHEARVSGIVYAHFSPGIWAQVVVCTAVCLPIWAAYAPSTRRQKLIRGAIRAVPRWGGDLDEAARKLNMINI